MKSYYPFVGAEEISSALQLDPSIEAHATLLQRTPGPVERALYKITRFDKVYYLYTVYCREMGDGVPLYEVYVATNMRDLQLAYGIIMLP